MRAVTASSARAHWAQLLSDVELGQTIAITRYARRVGYLVPAQAHGHGAREEAVRRFLAERTKWPRIPMSLEELLGARHEGHGV